MRQPLSGLSPGNVVMVAAALATVGLLAWMVSFSDGPANLFVGASAPVAQAR